MKANPYVYPSVDYADLTDISEKWRLSDCGERSLDEFIECLRPLVGIRPISVDANSSWIDRVLSIFGAPDVCYGESPLVEADYWKAKLEAADRAGKLSFTIFGFPFKMPVPLKTDRVCPDAGELASLLRLEALIDFVQQVAELPATLTIFAEDGFAPFIGLEKERADEYYAMLEKLVAKLPLEIVRLIRISDMEKEVGFKDIFQKNLKANQDLQKAGDPDFYEKFEGARLSIYRLLNVRQYSEEILSQVYSNLAPDKITQKAQRIRQDLERDQVNAICSYFAYLKTRDDLGFVEKICPGFLPLSVSPKSKRLGVFPVHKDCNILPYHGVPFLNEGKLEVRYLWDLKRERRALFKVHLDSDDDAQGVFLYSTDII
ncbi:MAG: L-tyrosine/L-tryptophan isonitrile synthase family protein [Oligoflexia bacterium]|nr:L-tyrosine/L-tryptophan isonitrile synthase family protein [Oligoflexia bacterium]